MARNIAITFRGVYQGALLSNTYDALALHYNIVKYNMSIKKIYDNWYKAREVLNGKVFWGYGKTPNEAIDNLYKNDFEQELINQKKSHAKS